MADDDELPMAEKLKLAQNFIANSPPGQALKVVDDVRKLIPNIDESSLAAMVAQVNQAQFLAVDVPGASEKVLLTPEGKLSGSGNFIEPAGRQKLKVDHLTQRCTGVTPLGSADQGAFAESAEPARKKVDAAMRRYAADCLGDAVVTTYGRDMNGKIRVTCCVARCNMKLDSFWSGSWRAEWNLVMTGATQGQLTGKVTCNVHYFEDGNVQLSDSTDFAKTLDWQGSDVGEVLAAQVKQYEEKFISSMEDIYQTMSESVLNALRRRLPITKTKFDWDNRAATHKLATELQAFKTG